MATQHDFRKTGPSSQRKKRARKVKKTYSMVGSPEYMAVEILDSKGYDQSVDYWSLGIILYELLYGVTPFVADTIVDVFRNVMEHEKVLTRFPEESYDDDGNMQIIISDEAWDLITKLLSKPSKRLMNFDVIKKHPFFKGLKWDKIRELEPPFVPQLENELDTSYFESEKKEDEEEDISEILDDLEQKDDSSRLFSNSKNSKKNQEEISKFAFAGFTFRHY
eukprot:TRINITY_DN2998_c0_g2_i1.p1 TRINITY_DN2998_c0_g2~~TRINITY_DN2998_c0_g2_i1.p1  ORF type:complete len:221 (+),score=52.03 TRINITY_DN2998_c0_g2_i1:99-761(+)